MFEKFIPKIITAEEYETFSPRNKRIHRVSTPEQIADVEQRRNREASRQAIAAPYIAIGGNPWGSDDGKLARVYFNGEFGSADGYVDIDTLEFVSKRAAVSNAEFAAKIQANLNH